MTADEHLEALMDIFEQDELSNETLLEELAWDSMAMLSVMALAKKCGKTLSGAEIREFETIGDILTALE